MSGMPSHCHKVILIGMFNFLLQWCFHDAIRLQGPTKLQELNLTGCKNLSELPPFDTVLPALQWLSLNGCERIQELDGSIGTLRELKYLDMSHCKNLGSLPNEMERLCSLEELVLSHCSSLSSVPKSIGLCNNLTELYLDHTGLIMLPDSLCDLVNLEKLIMSNCQSLVYLPHSIGHLKMLRICDFNGCSKLKQLPGTFSELTILEELNLSNCDLEELPERIGSLHKLTSLLLGRNFKLQRLPASIADLRSLRMLDLQFCPLQDSGMPEGIEKLRNLEEMNMQGTGIIKIPQNFAHLGNLSRLYLQRCSNLEEAAFFPSSLRFLDMGHCLKLRRVAGLDGLKILEHLVLCYCYQLRELSGLGGPKNLQSLNISGCGNLCWMGVEGLGASSVRQIHLSGSHVLPSKQLLQLPSLEHITYFGSKVPMPLEDRIIPEVDAVENANKLLMTIDIPISVSNGVRPPCFAIVMCLVSHDQGWSDMPQDYGSYLQSPTFVEGELVRDGCREGTVQLLFRNRHAECRDQVHLVILRHGCPLLRHANVGDKIEVRARSLYPAWRITVKHASYEALTDDLEQLNALLQAISVGSMEEVVCSSATGQRDGQQVPRSIDAFNYDMEVSGELASAVVASVARRVSLLVTNLDLDIRLRLQHELCHWRRNRQRLNDYFVGHRRICLDTADEETFKNHSMLLVHSDDSEQSTNAIAMKMLWRTLLLLHGDATMDLRSLPSISEVLVGEVLMTKEVPNLAIEQLCFYPVCSIRDNLFFIGVFRGWRISLRRESIIQ